MKKSTLWLACLSLLISSTIVHAESATLVERELPVRTVIDGFTAEQVERFTRQSTVTELLLGGDTSLWWTSHVSHTLPTAILPVRTPMMPLAKQAMPEIGKIKAKTSFGEMSLNEYLHDTRSYVQGFIVVHKGEIVYETYPGMRESDSHLWASNAKIIAALAVDLLISDGLVDDSKPFGHYVEDFRGTAWENISVKDILDMTPGLDTEENNATRSDPDSVAIRVFNAEFGIPSANGKVETVRDVLKDAKVIRKPGASFDYGSPVTQALVFLVEAVSNKSFPDFVDDRVWSKVGAEAPLEIHLAPDGHAAVHGIVSSRLRDMARFGMLFTPGWNKIAVEQVVTPEIISRVQEGVRTNEFFLKGNNGPTWTDWLGDDIISNSRQWDAVFTDGDMYKSGLMAQGLYVSPTRDLVIAYFSTTRDHMSPQRFLRPIATSSLLNK